jgi:hypothetical protein
MPSDQDYAAILADLEREKEELEAAIAVLRRKAGLGPTPDATSGTATEQIRADAFYRLGIGEAAVAYLRMTNRTPKTSAEIASALNRGGLVHQSKDLKATVNALLIRDGAKWGITRLPNNAWALDEWYSGSNRKPKRGQGRSREQVQTEPDEDVSLEPEEEEEEAQPDEVEQDVPF